MRCISGRVYLSLVIDGGRRNFQHALCAVPVPAALLSLSWSTAESWNRCRDARSERNRSGISAAPITDVALIPSVNVAAKVGR